MKRLKQIMLFMIAMVLFIVFSEYMIRLGLRNTYKSFSGEIISSSPQFIVKDSKTTDVNGYVNGIIKNNLDYDIEKIYIKLDLQSKRDVNLGTEYMEVLNLKNGEEREFEIKFKYSNVYKYILSGTENIE